MLALALLLCLQDARALAERLRSDSIEERDGAVEKLKAFGKAAAPEIKKLLEDSDAEVSGRAKYLLRYYEIHEKIPAAVRQSHPGIADRLAVDRSGEWIQFFIETGTAEKPARDLLEFLAPEAIRQSAETEEFNGVAVVLLNHRIRSASGALLSQLESRNYDMVYTLLHGLCPLEEIPRLRSMLARGQKAQTRRYAALLLGASAARAAIPDLAALSADPENPVRWAAVKALGDMDHADAVPAVLKFLQGSGLDVRIRAIGSLAALHAHGGAAPLLAALKDDPDPRLRESVIDVLRQLPNRGSADALLPLLEDSSPLLRAHVCRALSDPQARASIPALRRILKDPEFEPKMAALRALGRLGVRDAAADIAGVLAESDLRLRVAAAELLAGFDAREHIPALLAAAKDRRPEPRGAAAQALVRLGAREGIPILIEAAREDSTLILDDLNGFRRPERWAALDRKELTADPARPAVLAKAFEEAAGGPLEGRKIDKPGWAWLAEALFDNLPKGSRFSVRDLLARSRLRVRASFIVEPDRVLLLEPEEALRFWSEWWAAQK